MSGEWSKHLHRFFSGGCLSHRGHIRLRADHGREAETDHRMIVRHRHPDGLGLGHDRPLTKGSFATTDVPLPGLLFRKKLPPNCSTRSRMPTIP